MEAKEKWMPYVFVRTCTSVTKQNKFTHKIDYFYPKHNVGFDWMQIETVLLIYAFICVGQ